MKGNFSDHQINFSKKKSMEIYEGGLKNLEFIYKKFCIYSYIWKLQSPSKYSPFDVIRLLRLFSTAQKQFLDLLILMLFSVSAFFVSPLPYRQNIFLWRLFSSGKTKKSCSGRDQVNVEGGPWESSCFGQKLLNTQCGVGWCARKPPITKWANILKESSKPVHRSRTQPLTTTPTGALIQMGP